MELEKEKFIPGLTLRSLIFGIIYSVVLSALFMWMGVFIGSKAYLTFPNQPIEALYFKYGTSGESWPPLMFLIFVPVIVSVAAKRLGFTPQELTFILAMLAPIIVIPNGMFMGGFVGDLIEAINHPLAGPWFKENGPSFWFPSVAGPDDPAAKAMMTGGAVDWALWMGPIAYWSFFSISQYVFVMFLFGILRGQYSDIEALSFPLARSMTEIIKFKKVEGETEKPSLLRSKILWIGVAIGLLEGVITRILFGTDGIWPWQLVSGDFSVSEISIGVDLTPYAFISGTNSYFIQVWAIGLGLMLPTSLLASCVIWHIIIDMVLETAVLVPLNLIPPMPVGRGNTFAMRARADNMFRGATPLAWGRWTLAIGALIALAVYPIIVHRNYWIQSFKSFLGKSKSVGAESEFSHKTLWRGVFIFGILWLIAILIGGVPIHLALLTIIWLAIYYIGISRVINETGALGGYSGGLAWMQGWAIGANFAYYSRGLASNAEAARFGSLVTSNTVSSNYPTGHADIYGLNMESLQIAKLTRTRYKDVLISTIIGGAIAIVVFVLIYSIWIYSSFGASRYFYSWSNSFIAGWDAGQQGNVSGNQMIAQPETLTFIIIGAVISVILSFASAHLMFLSYVNPIGIVWNSTAGGLWWFAFLVALVIRALAEKAGGPQYIDRYIMPLAIGLMLGFVLILPFNMIYSAYWYYKAWS